MKPGEVVIGALAAIVALWLAVACAGIALLGADYFVAKLVGNTEVCVSDEES